MFLKFACFFNMFKIIPCYPISFALSSSVVAYINSSKERRRLQRIYFESVQSLIKPLFLVMGPIKDAHHHMFVGDFVHEQCFIYLMYFIVENGLFHPCCHISYIGLTFHHFLFLSTTLFPPTHHPNLEFPNPLLNSVSPYHPKMTPIGHPINVSHHFLALYGLCYFIS